MIEELTSNNDLVLVVMAHPDDEALICFGTLARLQSLGIPIHLLFLTDGGQGRAVKTPEVAKLISAKYNILDYPVSNLVFNRQIVTTIEDEIKFVQPSVLVTHSLTTVEHQDHIIVAQAATLAARRNRSVNIILQSEPPIKAENFIPNFFVNIDHFFQVKIEAVNLYRQVLDRWYMDSHILKSRAIWWGIQSENLSEQKLYEAFNLTFCAFR